MSEKPRRRRGGGSRAAMLAKRSKPPAINPAPAGPVGGQYRPLTETQVQQIYDTSLRMLAELGMGEAPQALIERYGRSNLEDVFLDVARGRGRGAAPRSRRWCWRTGRGNPRWW